MKLTAILVKVGEAPQVVQVENTLRALQDMVGGSLEICMPFEEKVLLLLDGDGKGKPENRLLFDEDGNLVDVLCGDLLIVGEGEEDFRSLTPQEQRIFLRRFSSVIHSYSVGNRFGYLADAAHFEGTKW